MGLTCANIHLFLGERDTGERGVGVDRLLDEACDRIGYERIDVPSPAESDLVAITARRWTSVCDPRGGGVATAKLAELTRRLSGASGCPVLLASVYDSDEFGFLIYDCGKQLDGYATQEDFLPVRFKPWSAKKRVEQWSRLFGTSLKLTDMRELTQLGTLFADDRLAVLCRLVGVPFEHAVLNAIDFQSPPAACPRCYRLRQQVRAVDSEASVAQWIPSNAELSHGGGATPRPLPLVPGEETSCHFVLTGPAGAFSDPILELSGPAIQRGLVEVLDVTGMWYHGEENILAGRAPWLDADQDQQQTDEGEVICRACLQGLSAREYEFPPEPNTRLTYSIRLRAVKEGVDTLRAGFLPSPQVTKSIPLSPVFHVDVAIPKWVPLDCDSHIRGRLPHPQLQAHALQTSYEGIRLLNTPTFLVGVVIMADSSPQRFAPIPELLQQWLTSLQLTEAWHVQVAYEGQMNPITFHIPRKKQLLRAEQIGVGKNWQKLFAKPAAIQSLFFPVVATATETAVAGASVQRTFMDDDLDVKGTIHLAFWRRCVAELETDEVARAARDHLSNLIDFAFETMDGLQGWVARWNWVPRFSMGEENNFTPYEQAYAIDSPALEHAPGGYMDERWCSRYLRGLSKQLWLGPTLLEQIDRERLAAVAGGEDIGPSSARFDLGSDLADNRVEEVLMPILPISGITAL